MKYESCLYIGEIEHRRHRPKENHFTYSVCYYYLDLSEIPKVFNVPFLMSYNSPGVLSFWRKDYLGPKSIDLDSVVRETITASTGHSCLGPIRVLTNISYFGFCFNPVSFYYCFNKDGKTLEFIVSEITNTPWGERHRQVFEMSGEQFKVFDFAKNFHVSPFLPMNIDYKWVFRLPNEELKVFMQDRLAGETQVIFDSSLSLKRHPLTKRSAMKAFLTFPFMTLKTMLAIYYQAAKIYLKRIPFYTHPNKEKSYEHSNLT